METKKRAIWNPLVIGLLLALVIAGGANPRRSIETAIWAVWGVPLAVGVTLGAFAALRAYRIACHDYSTRNPAHPFPELDAAFMAVFAFAIIGGLGAWTTREAFQAIASSIGGKRQTLYVQYAGSREGGVTRKSSCRHYVSFELPNGRTVEICAVRRFWGAIVNQELQHGVPVELEIVTNAIGSHVVRVEQP
jgi:hypothetical protein